MHTSDFVHRKKIKNPSRFLRPDESIEAKRMLDKIKKTSSRKAQVTTEIPRFLDRIKSRRVIQQEFQNQQTKAVLPEVDEEVRKPKTNLDSSNNSQSMKTSLSNCINRRQRMRFLFSNQRVQAETESSQMTI